MSIICVKIISQSDSELYNTHYNNALELNEQFIFSASISELEIAIKIAEKNGWEERYLNSSITLGELMRRSGDHATGIETLDKLTNSLKYPKLHVRKLGRLAALYFEGPQMENRSGADSATKYLEQSLQIAKAKGFKGLEASICNELGAFKMVFESNEKGKPYLKRSALLFKELKDSNNYVIAMCHLMHIKLVEEEYKQADKIGAELLQIVKDKEWYGTKQTLFRTYGHRFITVGDTLNYLKWHLKEKNEFIKFLKARSSNDMSSYRVKYDTEKFQEKAEKAKDETKYKNLQLNEEKKYTNTLFVLLIGFSVLIAGVVFLLLRQKRLSNTLKRSKDELILSNDSYQMLMIESNHRIKNNLQMVISMLEYASQDVRESGPKALKKISNKIYVISALHKFLYNDIHNDFIKVSDYFNEIVKLYNEIIMDEFEILVDICDVSIKSERIIYFGLIFNELLTNTIEHNNSLEKKIQIVITAKEEGFEFMYVDNSSQEGEYSAGTGSILIKQLVRRVKGKNFTLNKTNSQYNFTFNVNI